MIKNEIREDKMEDKISRSHLVESWMLQVNIYNFKAIERYHIKKHVFFYDSSAIDASSRTRFKPRRDKEVVLEGIFADFILNFLAICS